MSTLLVQSGTFDNIADAIRAKTGKVASMTPLEMPEEIASISGGGTSGFPILTGESNPTANSGENGQLYLQTLKGTMPSFYTFKGMVERANVMTVDVEDDSISFAYVSGSQIGAQAYMQIDLTNIDTIKVTVHRKVLTYFVDREYNKSCKRISCKYFNSFSKRGNI